MLEPDVELRVLIVAQRAIVAADAFELFQVEQRVVAVIDEAFHAWAAMGGASRSQEGILRERGPTPTRRGRVGPWR